MDMFEKLFGDMEKKTVGFYIKIFFFMAIPVFGLFYTMYLAFIEGNDTDLRRLARGAFVVRMLVIIAILIILTVCVIYIAPNIEVWLNKSFLLLKML